MTDSINQGAGIDLGSITTKAAAGVAFITIDGTRYEAVPSLPADEFGEFTSRMSAVNVAAKDMEKVDKDDLNAVGDAMREFIRQALNALGGVLYEDSVVRLTERVKSRTEPIDVNELMDVFKRLMAHYSPKKDDGEDPEAPTAGGERESQPSSVTTGPATAEPSSPAESTSPAGLPQT